MEPFSELQSLWAGTAPPPANSAEIARLVKRSQRRIQRKTLFAIFFLLLAIGVQVWILIWLQPRYVTTRIGLVLMMSMGGIAAAGNIRQSLLLRRATGADSITVSVQKMLLYQKRMKRYAGKQMGGMFALLSAGLLLYLYEFAHHSLWFTLISYSFTILYIVFCWVLLRPRVVRRQNAVVEKMIAHLELLQQDFGEENL